MFPVPTPILTAHDHSLALGWILTKFQLWGIHVSTFALSQTCAAYFHKENDAAPESVIKWLKGQSSAQNRWLTEYIFLWDTISGVSSVLESEQPCRQWHSTLALSSLAPPHGSETNTTSHAFQFCLNHGGQILTQTVMFSQQRLQIVLIKDALYKGCLKRQSQGVMCCVLRLFAFCFVFLCKLVTELFTDVRNPHV